MKIRGQKGQIPVGWIVGLAIIVILVAQTMLPGIVNVTSGMTVPNAISVLTQNGYVVWAAASIGENEVTYGTGSNSLTSEAAFTYNAISNTLTAGAFSGDGSGLTGVSAVADNVTGDFTVTGNIDAGTFTGDGSGLTGVAGSGNYTTDIASPSDLSDGGFIVVSTVNMTAGDDLLPYQACYIGSDGKLEKADASDNATCKALYLVLFSVSENATTNVLRDGIVNSSNWTFTAGSPVYVDTVTSGNLTTDDSGFTTGDQLYIVGIALGTNILDFRPSWVWGEVP